MCFFCCVTLRGVVYFVVTVHMVGSFVVSLIALDLFLYPPKYPDINLSPLIMSQLPLIVASYAILASFFAGFIFRAIDSGSISLLKWSTVGFGVYQSLVLCVQLLFSIMFGDILNTVGQGVVAGILSLNFFTTLVYLTLLFLYGKQLHQLKYGLPHKRYRNSLIPQENNYWGATLPSLYSKELNIPGLNLLQNHPAVTRCNSASVYSMTISTGTNTDSVVRVQNSQCAAATVLESTANPV